MLSSPLSSPLRSALSSAFAVRRGGGAPAFDPATLFGGTDRGGAVVLDNTSLLFQLSGGSTAVAVGDPIGYATDLGPSARPAIMATAANRPYLSGFPRQLGSELITNGRFATDTDWTKGTGWTINTASKRAEKTAGTASVLSGSISTTPGKFYFVTFFATRTAGTITARFTGGTTVSGQARSVTGSWVELIRAESGNTTFELSADAAFAGNVSNVTAKEVTQFVNLGALFDGVNDNLKTAAHDLSNSDKMTVVWSSYYTQPAGGSVVPLEIGNVYGSAAGSMVAVYGSSPQVRMRGSVDTANVTLANAEGKGSVPVAHVNIAELDIADAAILDEVTVHARGVQLTGTASGNPSGAGNFSADGVLTIGGARNGFLFWFGLIHRVFFINRTLSPSERAQAANWVRQGMVYAAVLGDSTVAYTNAAVSLPSTQTVASFVGGLVCGAADISNAGDRIADQKTKWTALPSKTELEVVIVQIGLNDVRSRVGANTATTAQVITDLQDLINTINADKPADCKVYVSQMTPCKAWLDGATNPTAAYAAWQDVNTAIAGGGATPITGVDGRITSHVAALSGAGDTLDAKYDMDGVHENNEGRFIIAQAWRTALEAGGLL
jgi:hypothetical protein